MKRLKNIISIAFSALICLSLVLSFAYAEELGAINSDTTKLPAYLNIGNVVYARDTALVIALAAILLLAANIAVSVIRKRKNLAKTARAMLSIIIGLALSAEIGGGCCYLFRLVTGDFLTNIHEMICMAMVAIFTAALTTVFACKYINIETEDIRRTFAYIHITLGIVMSFAVPEASYLFIFSGIMLTANELCISINSGINDFHGELLAAALYLPVIIPAIVRVVSTLDLSASYVSCMLFALALFGVAGTMVSVCLPRTGLKRIDLDLYLKEVSDNDDN